MRSSASIAKLPMIAASTAWLNTPLVHRPRSRSKNSARGVPARRGGASRSSVSSSGITDGQLIRPAVQQYDPSREIRVVGGELQGHIRAPGMPHDKWPRPAERANRPGQVTGDRCKVVAVVGRVRHAVTALVDRDKA